MRNFTLPMLMLFVANVAVAGNVVIPTDDMPFTVKEADIIRIPVGVATGGKMTTKLTGKAKETVNSVSSRVEGRTPIGAANQEVELRPSAKGKVTLEVSVTGPGGGEAKVTSYEITVE